MFDLIDFSDAVGEIGGRCVFCLIDSADSYYSRYWVCRKCFDRALKAERLTGEKEQLGDYQRNEKTKI